MKRYHDSPARGAMKWLCSMLGVVLSAMIVITLMFQYWLIQNDYATRQDFPFFSMKLPQWNISELISQVSGDKIGGFGSDIVNILLIGQDAQDNENAARSDSIILCTYNKETKHMTLTSFLRDLYVSIPGKGNNRINAAYSSGGGKLLKKTLEHNFDLHIDGSIEVDFTQFADIIDALGGVELELRQDEAEYINEKTGGTLTEGRQMLNGQQALAYARIRKLDSNGDFSRTDRQRKVLGSVMEDLKSTGLTDLAALAEEVIPMISTDLGTAQFLSLAMHILPNLSELELHSQYIPAQGTYTDETIDGMAVLVADAEQITQLLKDTLTK